MKLKNFLSTSTIIYSVILFTVLFLNVFLGIRPVIDYFNYLQESNLFFLIPLSLLLPIGLFLFDKVRYKVLIDEKVELFKTTVLIVQDIIQDSIAKTQLLIFEMKEGNADDKLLQRANEIFDKSNSLLSSLNNLDPSSTKLKSTIDIVKIFDVSYK